MNSNSELIASFSVQKMAELDAANQYVLACLFASESFLEFRDKVRSGISEVEINPEGVTTDAAFLNGKIGYIIEIEPYGETIKRDYVRNDDGTVVIYDSLNKAEKSAQIYDKFKPTIIDLETRRQVEAPKFCI